GKDPYAEFQHKGIRFAMFQRDKLPELLDKKPSYPTGINGSFELSINVGNPENVDKTYKQLLQNGAQAIN
ncbi:MAG TPA: glyoxalase, partial [Candidatus Cloacimonas sp.]|nr:glyoxalase [Candidatus Cloacimonas sp.]